MNSNIASASTIAIAVRQSTNGIDMTLFEQICLVLALVGSFSCILMAFALIITPRRPLVGPAWGLTTLGAAGLIGSAAVLLLLDADPKRHRPVAAPVPPHLGARPSR